MRWPTLVVALSLLFGIFAVYSVRAFFPGLHLDESLYVGAAQHILAGDVFLSRYWIDKPPLPFFLLAPGIVIAGNNGLGFHLAGLLFATAALALLFAVLSKLILDFSGRVALFLLTCALFLCPLSVAFGPSSFNDPFQIFFLLLFVLFIECGAPEKRIHQSFALALLCKPTTVLWAPALIGYWFVQEPMRLKHGWQKVRAFIFDCRWMLAVLILFQLTARQKFSQLNLITVHMGGKGTGGTASGIWERVQGWFFAASAELGGWQTGLGLLLMTSLSAFIYMHYMKNRESISRRALFLYVFPFWINLSILLFSPAQIFPRYLFLLFPQAVLVVASGYAVFKMKHGKGIFVLTGVICAWSLFVLSSFSLAGFKTHELTPRLQAQARHEILEEVPDGSIVHTDNYWLHYPYRRSEKIRLECARPECFSEALIGLSSIPRQYLSVSHQPLLQSVHVPDDFRQCNVDLTKVKQKDLWMERLRLRKLPVQLQVDVKTKNTFEIPKELKAMWKERPAIPYRVKVSVEKGSLVKQVVMEGELAVARNYRERDWDYHTRNVVGFRVKSIRVNDWDIEFSDLVPVLWRGYFLPLFAVECQKD